MHTCQPLKLCHVAMASPHILVLDMLPALVDGKSIRSHFNGFKAFAHCYLLRKLMIAGSKTVQFASLPALITRAPPYPKNTGSKMQEARVEAGMGRK